MTTTKPTGLYRVKDLTFAVNILDKRRAFDREELLIEPAKGHGSQWVTSKKVDQLTQQQNDNDQYNNNSQGS